MWDSVETPWKIAFMHGWEAFKNGSIPIGAVITDETGNILSAGRNRMYEYGTLNPKIAHAETECLLKLDLPVIKYTYQSIILKGDTYELYSKQCNMERQ